ncbi:hypothetical protein WS67_13155 [Burkholderia singularis]|uniref:Uncharacterized protein n=1 Tax=Burkholderia singularis TaxID=1503053 RepID=A0A118DNJ1_9BURK|nr:hypothetical protein AQ611_01810 [Burkholderia sp. Bp7605]KVE26572.1 hypothetical protein WS67_13155 [Burkholderia singularis]
MADDRSQRLTTVLADKFSTKLSTDSAALPRFLMRIQNLASKVMFYFNLADDMGAGPVESAGPTLRGRCGADD